MKIQWRLEWLRVVMHYAGKIQRGSRYGSKKAKKFWLSRALQIVSWRAETIGSRARREHVGLMHDPERDRYVEAIIGALINKPDYGKKLTLDPDGYDPYGNHVGSWRY